MSWDRSPPVAPRIMFEIGSVVIPYTFGEKRLIIIKDNVIVFRVDFDSIRWMKGLGIDPVEELTTMMIYELKDETARKEIFELLKNNLKNFNQNTK